MRCTSVYKSPITARQRINHALFIYFTHNVPLRRLALYKFVHTGLNDVVFPTSTEMQQWHSLVACTLYLWSICKMCQRGFLLLHRDSADSEKNRFRWLLILKFWRLLLVLLLSQKSVEPFTVITSSWTVHVKSNRSTYTGQLYKFVNGDVKPF